MTAMSKVQEASHRTMVAALVKPGVDILASLTPNKCNILHMAVGISGESGELLDAVKKAVIYNKPLDRENVIEELGDLEFYMEGLRQGLDISREQTLAANIHKLFSSDKARYKLGAYTDKQAQDRADKQED
tara:strand:- start:8747 stop:9139 length:393 start_codon:yes stop_codon:yes gene_type:complete